jgi:AraC-like DNA-binding protein
MSSRLWRLPELHNLELQSACSAAETPRHYHETFEIAVVMGDAQRIWRRGGWEVAPRRSIVVINPGDVHAIAGATADGWTARLFFPTAGNVRVAASEEADRAVPDPVFAAAVIEDTVLADQICALHSALDRRESLLEMETLSRRAAWGLVSRHAGLEVSARQPDRGPVCLGRARDYLHDHLDRNISLTELAAVAGMPRFGLVRAFARRYGMPPHAYLTQLRVLHARRSLSSGVAPSQAAVAAGFVDQSHLTRHFKRTVGVTPGQYRQACLTK